MFEFTPQILSDTRKQLHWASQLLSAAADVTVEKAPDDSHSNLGWNSDTRCLEGRSGVNLNVISFSLEFNGESYSLKGRTLADSAAWLGELLGHKLTFRDYEMPEHPVSVDGKFSPDESHLNAIATGFSIGQSALAGHGAIRIWPHHFDMGFWNAAQIEGRSIGGGFSIGDEHYDEPYFYINPYGIDRPESLPPLSYGHWTQLWIGAILTATEIRKAEGDAATVAGEFVANSFGIAQNLLA